MLVDGVASIYYDDSGWELRQVAQIIATNDDGDVVQIALEPEAVETILRGRPGDVMCIEDAIAENREARASYADQCRNPWILPARFTKRA